MKAAELMRTIKERITVYKNIEHNKALTNEKINYLLEFMERVMSDNRFKKEESRNYVVIKKVEQLRLWFLLDDKIFQLFIENLKNE